jgi:hypothetical protein
MPDVFNGNWNPSPANIRSSGATRLLVKAAGDSAFYALGAPRGVDSQVAVIYKNDALLRALGWGFKPVINVPSLQAGLAELKILDKLLVSLPLEIALTELDGINMQDDGTKLGLRWTIECGGKFDDFRMIKYYIAGNLSTSEHDSLYNTTPVVLGTPGTGDVLATLSQTNVAAHQKPNGLSKFEFKAAADSLYADFGEFEDSSYTFTCLGPLSGGGRQIPRTTAIQFKGTVKGLQTSLTETQLMDAIVGNEIDVKMTHMDGVVLTMPHTNIGFVATRKNVGNADKWRTMDLEVGGVIIKDSTGLIFQTSEDTPTIWPDIWS